MAEADGRVVVAVADFVNETREPELDGLSGQLITSLEQSQRLRVLTRTRMVDVLRRLGKPSVAAVDEALGREVALAAGVRALVVATIRRFDQLYAIDLKVLDPKTSEYFFTLKEEHAGKDSIPGMLDRLSEEARLRLREGPADVQASRVRVAEALTGSFAAYQHFFRGDQFKDSIHYDQAILEYRKAIAIDPGFALAHYRIAYLGHFTGLDEAARRAEIDAALRGVDRVAEKERLLIQAWKAVMDGRKEEAHQLYARVVAAYPQDKEALFMAGDLYLHEERQAEGMPFFERAVALDPAWEPAMMHLVDSLYALGRDGELMVRSREWTERAPGGQSFRALAMAYSAAGKPAEAVAAARRAYEIDRTAFARANLGEALLFGERFQEAEALARQVLAAPLSEVEASGAMPQLIAALAYQGRRREALQLLDAAPPDLGGEPWLRDSMRLDITLGDDKPEAALALARALAKRADGPKKVMPLILALLGDPAGAAEAAKALHAGSHLDLYEAAAGWRRGDTDQAVRRLRAVIGRPADRDSHAPALWMLARLAVERGQARDAVAAVERFRVTHGGVWRSWALPESLLLEARAQEQLGERSKAAATLDHLLELWKRADPDLPRLAEARAMRARLASSGLR